MIFVGDKFNVWNKITHIIDDPTANYFYWYSDVRTFGTPYIFSDGLQLQNLLSIRKFFNTHNIKINSPLHYIFSELKIKGDNL